MHTNTHAKRIHTHLRIGFPACNISAAKSSLRPHPPRSFRVPIVCMYVCMYMYVCMLLILRDMEKEIKENNYKKINSTGQRCLQPPTNQKKQTKLVLSCLTVGPRIQSPPPSCCRSTQTQSYLVSLLVS